VKYSESIDDLRRQHPEETEDELFARWNYRKAAFRKKAAEDWLHHHPPMSWIKRNRFQIACVIIVILLGVLAAKAQVTSTNIVRVGGNAVTTSVPVSQATGTNLHIVCDSGCGGAASFTDSSAFTFATSSINNISAVVDDISTNTVAENSAGAVRMSGSRILYVDLSKTVLPAGTNVIGHIICDSGCGGAATFTDSSAFTFGTTAVNNTSFVVDDVATNTVAENSAGAARMNTNRILYMDLSKTAANATAIKVDNSAVTQPVSGTVATSNMPTTVDTNSGVKSASTLRVVLATDQPALTNKLLVTPDSVALPANQSVNVNQLAGTATSVNSGVKDAGTLRVVLATDQPALTNKLLVTPDSVALPANQSVNVAQVNGVTTTTGAGATGTGVQRINDVASSATAAAVPASASYTGGSDGTNLVGFFVDPCAGLAKSYFPVNISTATTVRFAAPTASKKTYICSIVLVAASADNVNIIEGTGGTCGTATAGVAGGTTAATGFNLAANGGLTLGNGASSVMATAGSNVDMCLITSAAVQLSGHISWVQR
jgi:hypothetical protein